MILSLLPPADWQDLSQMAEGGSADTRVQEGSQISEVRGTVTQVKPVLDSSQSLSLITGHCLFFMTVSDV